MTWKSSSAMLAAVAGALALVQTAARLGGQETSAALSIDATAVPAAVRALAGASGLSSKRGNRRTEGGPGDGGLPGGGRFRTPTAGPSLVEKD